MGNEIEINEMHVLAAVVIIAFMIAGYALVTSLSLLHNGSSSEITQPAPRMTQMKLSPFDRQLALQFMDKDGDGKCDACGMPVEACIDSGQMQCNMDPASTIGILGGQHIHADFKVFINGKPLNFADAKYYMKSSFIHVDNHQNKEDASGVLHMHATGVPLRIFFNSVGMDFNKNCVTLPEGKFCNDSARTVKFYVNGRPNSQWENYVFNDSDKILISYGEETDLSQQLNSITDFAKSH